jgi:hypothetical protein
MWGKVGCGVVVLCRGEEREKYGACREGERLERLKRRGLINERDRMGKEKERNVA